MKKISRTLISLTACVIGFGIIVIITKDTSIFSVKQLSFADNLTQTMVDKKTKDKTIFYNESTSKSDNIEFSNSDESDKTSHIDDKMAIKPKDGTSPQIVIIPGNPDIDSNFSKEPEKNE